MTSCGPSCSVASLEHPKASLVVGYLFPHVQAVLIRSFAVTCQPLKWRYFDTSSSVKVGSRLQPKASELGRYKP